MQVQLKSVSSVTTLRPEKVGLAKPKTQRPPLGPLTNEARELERKVIR